MSDILGINNTQAKILKNMLKLEKFDEKKKPFGITGYDLHKRTDVHRKPLVSISTWVDNYQELARIQLIREVKRQKKRKKKRGRVSYPFTITSLGFFAYLKWLKPKDFVKDFDLELLSNFIPPLIANHWLELNELGKRHSKLKELFEKLLQVILKESVNQIEIQRLPKESYTRFGRALFEKTTIPIVLGKKDMILTRSYQSLSKRELEEMTKVQKKLKKGFKLLALVLPNYDQIPFNVINRITFLFYYNLLKLADDIYYTMHTYGQVLEADKRFPQTLEGEDARMNYELSGGRGIQNEIKKIMSRVMLLISKDAALSKIFVVGLKEVDAYFEKPRLVQALINIVNDKKIFN